jgi:hypothetical protein
MSLNYTTWITAVSTIAVATTASDHRSAYIPHPCSRRIGSALSAGSGLADVLAEEGRPPP